MSGARRQRGDNEEREKVSSEFFEVVFLSMIIDDHLSKKTKEEREEVAS